MNRIELTPVYVHTIAITVVDAGASQTDEIIIDGVKCTFTSDATPTATEISTGLRAAIAASPIAGLFTVTGVTNVILTPTGIFNPPVMVSKNLTDVITIGVAILDVDVATLPGTVAADIAESKRQLTGPVLFPMSGAATHTISATAAQLISFVLQAVNAGIITIKDGDTTLLTFAAGALSPGQAVFIGAMMTNPKIVFAGADVGVATYIPTAS